MRKFIFFAFLLFLLPAGTPMSLAEEQEKQTAGDEPNFQYHNVKTPEGLIFRLPEDMSIEKKNGLQTPMPFDEYMYGKFKQMDRRLNSIDQKLDRIEKLLAPEKEQTAAGKSEAPHVLISK